MNTLNSTYVSNPLILDMPDYKQLIAETKEFNDKTSNLSNKIHKDLKAIISDRKNYTVDTKKEDVKQATDVIRSMLNLYSGHDNNIILTEYVYTHFYLTDSNCSPSDCCKPFMDFAPAARAEIKNRLKVLRMIDDSVCEMEDIVFVG